MTLPATDARPQTTRHHSPALTVTAVAGLAGGTLLLIDVVTITIRNGNFGVADDILFLAGFAGLWIAAIALAVQLSGRSRGAARVGLAIGYTLLIAVVLGGLALAMDFFGRHVFSTANAGLHGEWSFFTVGLCLVILGGLAWRRMRRTR